MAKAKLTLSSVEELFSDTSPFPAEMIRDQVVEDLKMTDLAGANPSQLKISFDADQGSDILIRRIDPKQAQGYLVFQDERDYTSWLSAALAGPPDSERSGNGNGT